MEIDKKVTLEQNIPVEALSEVLDHYWRTEIQGYRESPTSVHILHQLAKVASWLTGCTDWTAADYASNSGVMPEMGWRVGGIAEKAPPPEASLQKPETEAQATWVSEGPTRYRLQGQKPSVQVVVGWDRPMSTFFAQVWDVPEDNSHYEQGNLLLWLGTDFYQVEEIDDLGEALAPFVTLPKEIRVKLAGHMVFGA